MTLRKLLPTWYKYPTEARAETTHLQAWETEMGKKTAKAATPAGKGGGRGGAGRGQGRKAKGATPAAKPAGHDPSDTRVQQTLAGLLGARADQVANPKRPAVYAADVLKWNVKDAEGDDAPQKQVNEGPVAYSIETQKEYIILRIGSEQTQELYWHDSNFEEVPEGDARAVDSKTRGGPGDVQIREVGKEGSEQWVTKGHVTALAFS